MQVKKFEAPTLQEALDTIKRELGPEAIILQTKQNKRGFGLMSKGSVEVTAAVSERSTHKKAFAERRIPEATKKAIHKLPAEKQAGVYDKYLDSHLERAAKTTRDRVEMSGQPPAGATAGRGVKPITARRYIDIGDEETAPPRGRRPAPAATAAVSPSQPAYSLAPAPVEEEVRHLKRMIQELKSAQDENLFGSGARSYGPRSALATPALQDAFDQLVVNGMEKRFALGLVKKVSFELGEDRSQNPDEVLDALAAEIMSGTQVAAPAIHAPRPMGEGAKPGPMIVALVGPTGVGKTTTVAKMASEALLRRNLKVGLINLDSYKVAAFDQLATYAKILNVPFRSAASADDLRSAIADFQSLDLVLIDTTGRSPRDPGSLKEMQDTLASIEGVHAELVLSATTRDAELYDTATRFAAFRPRGVTFSKLDEATCFGAIYNVTQKSNLPLIYFTTGQRVPEDIEEATRERVAALVMDL
jgi:flagellar biosynthesis protein FlhF